MHKLPVIQLTREQGIRLEALEMALHETKRRMVMERRSDEYVHRVRDYSAALSELNDYKREIGLR